MTEKYREQIIFGDIEIDLPKTLDAIQLARRLLDLFEEGIDSEMGIIPGDDVLQKTPKNVSKRTPTTSDSGPEKKFIQTGEIQKLPTVADILIEKFPFDKSQEKPFKTLFYIEFDDGRVVLSYMGGRCYTTKENVLKLPYPVPNGYLKGFKVSSNNGTALRLYRECLAGREGVRADNQTAVHRAESFEAPRAREGEKLHPVPPFGGNKGKPVLNGFAEAPRFDYSHVAKQTLGKSVFWELNGCFAIKKEGDKDIVFATKEQINIIKKLDKEALKEHIKNLNMPKQYVLREFIENLKDADIGALQILKTDTRGSHGEDFEKFEGV